ncbi:DUF5677 domain-containing protein [Pedobacter sp. JCM 36344]|uniref:DUF5677 domain-containing protein n=1 Tax=Pedobacter sp. JCM 36344 TaxID=3374280 RepID=UPI003979F5D4
MKEIGRIRDLDDEIFEEFQKYFLKIKTSDFVKKYPYTNILLSLFDTSGTFIKNSIYDSCETDDYFAVKILYRCLIEHYVKFKFIFVKWGLTKSDDFAYDFQEYGHAREVLDSLRAKISEHQLFDPTYTFKDWDDFLKEHPKFKNKTRKEVEDETKKYTFKNIVSYLNGQFKAGDTDLSNTLGKFIIDYSNLSSFVHGGMKSCQEMMSMNSKEKRQTEYIRMCGLSFQLSNSIKLFSLIMYIQTDKDAFSPHYLKVDNILKKINNAP